MDKSTIILGCQSELVEDDMLLQTRLRQAQADTKLFERKYFLIHVISSLSKPVSQLFIMAPTSTGSV